MAETTENVTTSTTTEVVDDYMTAEDRAKFELTFQRPANYYTLTADEQSAVDTKLGLVEWQGNHLSAADLARFVEFFGLVAKTSDPV